MSGGDGPARPLRVALAGCGTVGGALVELLAAETRDPREPCRVAGVERILVRRRGKPRSEAVGSIPRFTDPDRFLRTDAEVVVEAIGGTEPALTIARSTLARGASFVTANKELVRRHGPELRALAEVRGGRFLFEAAVAGGVPVVRTLRSSFSGHPVRRITGVLNGTCNFVLSELDAGRSFDEALELARSRGYAEADATRDLDGRDAADKIAILAWVAWGVEPAEVELRIRGLLPDPEELVAAARASGERVRLLADCRFRDGRAVARVQPVRVPAGSGFGRTVGVQNRIRIETRSVGTYELAGPGAGGPETASALLSDLRSLVRAELPTASATLPS